MSCPQWFRELMATLGIPANAESVTLRWQGGDRVHVDCIVSSPSVEFPDEMMVSLRQYDVVPVLPHVPDSMDLMRHVASELDASATLRERS